MPRDRKHTWLHVILAGAVSPPWMLWTLMLSSACGLLPVAPASGPYREAIGHVTLFFADPLYPCLT